MGSRIGSWFVKIESIKDLTVAAERQHTMARVHKCLFCGWSRPAPSGAMLTPLCATCGAVMRCEDGEDPAAGASGPAEARGRRMTTRLAGAAVGIVLVLTMTRAGFEYGGVPIALAALGVAVLLVIPLVASVGHARRDAARR